MAGTHVERAITLCEVVVITVVLALLLAIATPALQAVDEDVERTLCLGNLRMMGQASWAYAADDPRDQLTPLHQRTVSTLLRQDFLGTQWGHRTAMPASFGGRTATRPFPTEVGEVTVMMDKEGPWATRTRPLTIFLQSDTEIDLAMFRCPADRGYPDSLWSSSSPSTAFNIPLYEMLGNSYRTNSIGLRWTVGGWFTSGVWGHTASSIQSPLSRTVLYSEPLFYEFSRHGEGTGWAPPIPGWHGRLMSDNVAYSDGSARMTRVGVLETFTSAQLAKMGYTPNFSSRWFLRRGPTWRTDSFPTPGAQIRVFRENGQNITPTVRWTGWPFDDHQFNLPP